MLIPVPESVSEKEKAQVPHELSPETFKWLYTFVQDAIDGGLTVDSSPITEEAYEELSRHDLIERTPSNDGDYAWHGKVRLEDSFVREILKGINLYGIIRGIVYERSQR